MILLDLPFYPGLSGVARVCRDQFQNSSLPMLTRKLLIWQTHCIGVAGHSKIKCCENNLNCWHLLLLSANNPLNIMLSENKGDKMFGVGLPTLSKSPQDDSQTVCVDNSCL